MPFLLVEILNFQGSIHHIGVGSFSQLFVSIRKGFITRSLGLKRSQEFSYAQQAAGTSGFFYFAGNCIYFENEHKRHSLFLCLNAGKGGLRKQMIPELARHKRKETLCQSKELRIL